MKLELEIDAVKPGVFKVLIVEDDLDICYLLSGILKKKKLASGYVNNLLDAEKALKKDTPDILILDNHLPDGLGVDFLTFIKAVYPQIKIIMITAHDTLNDKMNALDKGADYFLGKPFTIAAINTTLENITH